MGLCCHLASRSRKPGRSLLLLGKSVFLLLLGAVWPSERPQQQTNIPPPPKKINKEQNRKTPNQQQKKGSTETFLPHPIELQLPPWEGFFWTLCALYYKFWLDNAVGIWALLQYPFSYPHSLISIISQVESFTCCSCPRGSLWFRRCVFPLISHIYISWVVQGSEGRARCQEQKSQPWVCRAWGLKAGETERWCLFFLKTMGNYCFTGNLPGKY